MKSPQLTVSAAVFFEDKPAPMAFAPWFERARAVFTEFNLSPVLFTANGSTFEFDDCYVLGNAGEDVYLWDEALHPRLADLTEALRGRTIDYLGLDSPRASAEDRSDWRASISLSSVSRDAYLGADESLIASPSAALSRVWQMAGDLCAIRYGFAYQMPLADLPDCYATGNRNTTFAEVREMIRHRREWERRIKTSDELWTEELRGARRHLTGLFRGAYPANILSDAHVRSAALDSSGIGTLTKLNNGLWLWELSDAQLPLAQSWLESRRVLVSQNA